MNLVTFGSTCKLQNGRAFKPAEWSERGTPIVRIQNLNDESKPFNYCDFEVEERFHINTGDLLFSWSGTPGTSFGAFFWNRGKGFLNQHIFRVDVDEENVDKGYLRYAINSKLNQIIDQAHGGVGLKHITKGKLEAVEIPLPPLAEQKRIAAILDKADSLRRKRQQAIDLTGEFLRAIFLDMFGDPVTNPKGWDVAPLQEVSPSQPNRNVEANDDEKVWLLNLDKVESNTGRLLDKEICNYSEAGNSTSWFDESHVLYSKLRPYLNKVVLPTDKGLATTELVPLKPNSELLTREYLTCLLRSDCFVSWANGKVAGAKMPRLSMAELRSFDLPLPPIEIQNNFSKIYKATMANLEQYRESDSSQVLLFDSLSQKAFKGELSQKNAA